MDTQYAKALKENLQWFPELGYGFYPVTAGIEPYGQKYWDEYVRRGRTTIGRRLNEFRVGLVNKYANGAVVDIGIGAGTFVQARNLQQFSRSGTLGYDVNPIGIRWLKERDLWCDWEKETSLPNVTMWDVLEHLLDPKPLLDKITGHLFVSIPIFDDCLHALTSKHYKPMEHCRYWTKGGFVAWMEAYGFTLEEFSDGERVIGREDVGTFVFRRTA